MNDSAVIASDQGTGRVAGARKSGFYYNWGPQAWIDMWMSNSMLVKKAMPIISHTFVPILRLSGDKEQVDRDYDAIKSRTRNARTCTPMTSIALAACLTQSMPGDGSNSNGLPASLTSTV